MQPECRVNNIVGKAQRVNYGLLEEWGSPTQGSLSSEASGEENTVFFSVVQPQSTLLPQPIIR